MFSSSIDIVLKLNCVPVCFQVSVTGIAKDHFDYFWFQDVAELEERVLSKVCSASVKLKFNFTIASIFVCKPAFVMLETNFGTCSSVCWLLISSSYWRPNDWWVFTEHHSKVRCSQISYLFPDQLKVETLI